jgi:hypothetical protein
LPSQFADGSFFVLLRLPRSGRDSVPLLSESVLDNAVALLSP